MSDIFIELLYLISDKVCYFAIVCAFTIPANIHKRPGKKRKSFSASLKFTYAYFQVDAETSSHWRKEKFLFTKGHSL